MQQELQPPHCTVGPNPHLGFTLPPTPTPDPTPPPPLPQTLPLPLPLPLPYPYTFFHRYPSPDVRAATEDSL